jgi:hypothetical protein
MGAGVAKPTKEAGEEVFGLFKAINEKFKTQIKDLYNKALGSDGRNAWYDAVSFNTKLTKKLADSNLTRRLPESVKKEIADFVDNPQSFTVDAKSNFQSIIAQDMRTALRSGNGAEYSALKASKRCVRRG